MGEVTRRREATLRAILAAAKGGQHAAAAALAESALKEGLEHPLVLNVAALKLEQEGRVHEAEGLLRRAVTGSPSDVASRNALGLCLMRLERPADALAQFEAVIALNPALPFAHASRGAALSALGSTAAAESSYRHAVGLDPRQGVALSALANLAAGRGAYGDARALAGRALAELPGYPEAVMSLAAADLGEGRLADAEARLRALLADSRLSPLERAHAEGLLGDVLDAKNYTDEAFAAYTRCNAALRSLNADRFGGAANALSYARALDAHFSRVPPEPWRVAAQGGTRPTGAGDHVFLLGFPRSGTTLLEVILEGHPRVVSLEENESLIDGVHEFMQRPEDLAQLAAAPRPVLDRLRGAYWRRVAAAGLEVARKTFIDKHPLNVLKLPLIARLFPDAKILFACRDPRDIVLSCYRHRFKMSAPIFELLTLKGAAAYYDAVMQLAVRFSSAFALPTCLVRHEDVVTGFALEMKRICAFLGLEWDPAMGDFALRTQYRASLTPSTAQLARGLNTEGLGHWHRYRQHLTPVLPILEPWVKRFYYDEQAP